MEKHYLEHDYYRLTKYKAHYSAVCDTHVQTRVESTLLVYLED